MHAKSIRNQHKIDARKRHAKSVEHDAKTDLKWMPKSLDNFKNYEKRHTKNRRWNLMLKKGAVSFPTWHFGLNFWRFGGGGLAEFRQDSRLDFYSGLTRPAPQAGCGGSEINDKSIKKSRSEKGRPKIDKGNPLASPSKRDGSPVAQIDVGRFW